MLDTNEIGGIEGSDKLINKCEKLSKTEKLFKSQKLSKTEKLSKSQKLAKSRKKILKSGNFSNFYAKKNGLSFLTPNAKTTFDYL